jgi:hemerythrin-like domain-containing protein
MPDTDTRDMILVHRVFRREFRLLARMVQAIGEGDAGRAAEVGRHAREMSDALHHHHESEDELLWPRLALRAPGAGLTDRMAPQHAALGAILGRIDAALPRWQRSPDAASSRALAADLASLHAQLEEHLDDEEESVLPVVGRVITTAEWDELGERGFAAMPKRRALVFLGYILEGASAEERSRFLRRVPPPVRLLYRLVGRRAYARESAALRSGFPEPAPAA